MKRFVIVPGLDYYFFNQVSDPLIYVEEEKFLKKRNWLSVFIQRICKKLNIWRIYSLFIRDWEKKIQECDCCIVFDQAFSISLIKCINAFNPKIKIIVYLWNPVFKNLSFIKNLAKIKSYISIYSFDKNDCKKYGFIFSPMIYNFDVNISDSDIEYDVVFVGYSKNRSSLLKELYLKLILMRKKLFFYVLDNVNIKEKMPFELHNSYLDYNIYKEAMKKSRALLDIVQENQIGLTIRSMEAMCYKKKLITNNRDIISYDFYNRNNIFVIGIDDIDKLDDFLKLPYKPIDQEIIKEYNFIDWVKSF